MRLAFVLLFVTACARIPVYVGTSEPDALTAATADAVDRWNGRLGVDLIEVRAVAVPAVAHADLFAIVVSSKRWGADSATKPTNAYTNPWGPFNHIYVRSQAIGSLPHDSLEWIVDHEIGHVFGLGHDDSTPNLMNAAPVVGQESRALSKRQGRRARAIAGIEAAF